MKPFAFSRDGLTPDTFRDALSDPRAGAYASFEGWVRNLNDGRDVQRLDYEAYEELGVKEGERIIAEALDRFDVARVAAVHRLGSLEIGDLAVWVGASSAHRDAAFAACRYVIDEVKRRVPIWKKEQYAEGDSGWINCEVVGAEATSGRDAPAR